jgi:predicted acylesterase/phospholipase RssA
MRKKLILSIDGGGIRGLFPLYVLQFLQERLHEQWRNFLFTREVQLFSGTSTGAIISAALMLQDNKHIPLYSVEDIIDLYANRGKQIFNNPSTQNTKLFPLKIILESNFGQFLLKDIRQNFLFLSYDIQHKAPFVFQNKQAELEQIPLSSALLACSAIPDFFPAVVLGNRILVDGVCYSKNTAWLAYQAAKSLFPENDLLFISLGTGQLKTEDDMEQNATNVHLKMLSQTMLDKHLSYFRFQPKVQLASDAMDDASQENILHLQEDTKTYMHSIKSMIDDFLTHFVD